MILNSNKTESQELHDVAEVRKLKWSNRWKELAWLCLIVVIGLFSRLLFIRFYPTIPISDFLSIIDFAFIFSGDIFAKNAWHWHYFSPGLSMIISVMLDFPINPQNRLGGGQLQFQQG